MKNSVLTDRYAKALFEIAVENNAVDEFNDDLASLVGVFQENQKLVEIFEHPRLPKKDKNQIIDDFHNIIFENQYIKNFLHLLVQKKREKQLEGIFESWREMYNSYKKIMPVEVISASKLSDEQMEKLKSNLATKLKREPIINMIIEPRLLGGIIVKYQDKIIDGSVLKQVKQLTASIKDIPVAKLRGEVV